VVAVVGRLLGNEFGRQVKMEIGGSHGWSIVESWKNGQFTFA